MNKSNKIKEYLKPTQVVEHYLGQPVRNNRIGLWYKSPFRNERTASFCVNDTKGIHDFGTSEHYDIIGFVEKYFNIDFKRAIDILCFDFGIPEETEMSRELEEYLKRKRIEENKIKEAINNWYNQTLNELCKELHFYQKAIPHLRGQALAIAYSEEQKLDYTINNYIDNSRNKEMLYRNRKTIEK